MEPPFFSILSFIVAIVVFWFDVTAIAAPTIKMLKSEERAVVQSGWWSRYTNTSLSPCQFPGITCNQFGSITKIELCCSSPDIYDEFGKMNFSLIPNLEYLEIINDQLISTIPSQICALSKLKYLSLHCHYLSGNIPSCLGNLYKLETLDLFDNSINGSIPSQLGNVKNLASLNLSQNYLDGSIPSQLGSLKNLVSLDLSRNHLSGFIPSQLGSLRNLASLDLSSNYLNGSIPSQLGNVKNLASLNLSHNYLDGSIPSQLRSLKNLASLDLSLNDLDGSIPSQLGSLQNLASLDLSKNYLSDSIPLQLGNLKNLASLNLSSNDLGGSIPSQLGSLKNLTSLDLSQNYLSGSIPSQLGTLKNLASLDLSWNLLTGSIPSQLGSLKNLSDLNLSYNYLLGHILHSISHHYPKTAFDGNYNLVYDSPPKTIHKILHCKEIILPVVFFSFSLIIFVVIWLYFRKRVKPFVLNENIIKSKDTFSIWNYDGRIAYEEVVKATEDFDLKYCIGIGGYGSVYRAKLPNGKVFAIKKLHRLEAEEPAFDKSFKNEVKLLTEIRHRNIIKLYGFCLHKRCMFLVYEYMERGSLFCALRNDAEALELNWSKRLNIVKDVAHAVSYLHHHCSPSIIHRDLSTNNILLNNEMQAFVSDFGMARFLDPASTNVSAIAGTFGYIAPEFAYTMILNYKSDVYSYGVVAMETIMGKHPEEIISKLSTPAIEHVKLREILDSRLPWPHNGSLIAGILQVASYALACLSSDPKSRPSMKHISEAFLNEKTIPFHNSFYEITLGQLQDNYEEYSARVL